MTTTTKAAIKIYTPQTQTMCLKILFFEHVSKMRDLLYHIYKVIKSITKWTSIEKNYTCICFWHMPGLLYSFVDKILYHPHQL